MKLNVMILKECEPRIKELYHDSKNQIVIKYNLLNTYIKVTLALKPTPHASSSRSLQGISHSLSASNLSDMDYSIEGRMIALSNTKWRTQRTSIVFRIGWTIFISDSTASVLKSSPIGKRSGD